MSDWQQQTEQQEDGGTEGTPGGTSPEGAPGGGMEADQPAGVEFENEPSPHQGEEGQEPA